MALEIIHNHNLLPVGVYRPKYPLTHLYGFAYNTQILSLCHNNETKELVLSFGEKTIVLDSNISANSAYTTNAIVYFNNFLWVGYSCEFDKFYFCIVDLQSRISRKYESALNPKFIKPVGRDYWTYTIDETSSVPVFTWESLERLGNPISPVVIDEPGTKYYSVEWRRWRDVCFVAVNGKTLKFVNRELSILFFKDVREFFPQYKKLTHPNSSVLYDPDYLITINDNCLLYYEWYNVIEQKWGDIEGCESKYCWNFITEQSVPFAHKILDYYVTNLFPFYDFDGIIKLHSSEFYPAGSWKTIYEPEEICSVPIDSALGKRKADCQITPDN